MLDVLFLALTIVILWADLSVDRGPRAPEGRRFMNWLYVIAGLISLALFVYLIVALLKPEVF